MALNIEAPNQAQINAINPPDLAPHEMAPDLAKGDYHHLTGHNTSSMVPNLLPAQKKLNQDQINREIKENQNKKYTYSYNELQVSFYDIFRSDTFNETGNVNKFADSFASCSRRFFNQEEVMECITDVAKAHYYMLFIINEDQKLFSMDAFIKDYSKLKNKCQELFTESIDGIFEKKDKYSINNISKKWINQFLFNFLTLLYVHAALYNEGSPIVNKEIIGEICNPLNNNFGNPDIKGNEDLFSLKYYFNDTTEDLLLNIKEIINND